MDWQPTTTTPLGPGVIHVVWDGTEMRLAVFWPVKGQGWFGVHPNCEEYTKPMRPQPTHWLPIPAPPDYLWNHS